MGNHELYANIKWPDTKRGKITIILCSQTQYLTKGESQNQNSMLFFHLTRLNRASIARFPATSAGIRFVNVVNFLVGSVANNDDSCQYHYINNNLLHDIDQIKNNAI